MFNPFNCGVYRWLNTVNGKSYIGSSASVCVRKREHYNQLTSNTHHSIKLQRAWNKYGEVNFEFEMLTLCKKEDLLWQEQLAIDVFNAVKHGYNVCPFSTSPMAGRKHSETTKAAMSLAQTGRVQSEETKQAISKAKQGVKFSVKHKKAISLSKQGSKQSEEHKAHVITARRERIEEFSKGCREAAWRLSPEYRAWRAARAAANRWGSSFTEPEPAPMKGNNHVNG